MRTEVGDLRSEVGGWRIEVRGQKSEVGGRRLDCGFGRWEVKCRGQRPEDWNDMKIACPVGRNDSIGEDCRFGILGIRILRM